MGDSDGSATGQLEQLANRFGKGGETTGDVKSSEKPFWKRYGAVFQLLAVAGAFGGAIVSIASTAIDRTMAVARESGPALLDTVLPILSVVTLLAVAVSLVVVALSLRNV